MLPSVPMKLVERTGKTGRFTISNESYPVGLHLVDAAVEGEYFLVEAGFAIQSLGSSLHLHSSRNLSPFELLRKIDSLTGDREINLLALSSYHSGILHREKLKYQITPRIKFAYGPGCSLCNTPAGFFETMASISRETNCILLSSNNMLSFPLPDGTMKLLRETGSDIRSVGSPLDVVRIAELNPDKEIVYAAIGSEIMLAAVAATIQEVKQKDLRNIAFYLSLKNSLSAIPAFIEKSERQFDGILLPAETAAITGWNSAGAIAEKYNITCVLADYEPLHILRGIIKLIEPAHGRKKKVDIACRYHLTPGGNSEARALIDRYFIRTSSAWPGFGNIPDSGYRIVDSLSHLDALRKYNLVESDTVSAPGCSVADVTSGRIIPSQCPLFSNACTPDHPRGPGMLASDGLCTGWYQYSSRFSDV